MIISIIEEMSNQRRTDPSARHAWVNKQLKIASFLAMTAIFIANGRNKGRQHHQECHYEEERRGNLLYFYRYSTGCTPFDLLF